MANEDEMKRQAEFDQAMASIGDSFPPLWRRLYANLMSEGFTDRESFELLKVYILSQCPFGVNGAK